jgi:hypothetical protein
MAQLVRCYFRQGGAGAGAAAEDVTFQAGTAFQLALDVEFTNAEIAVGGTFRVMVGVKNFNTNVAFIPVNVGPAPAHNTPAGIAGSRNQTFAYTIPAGSGAAGQFLNANAALVVGAIGQDGDIGEATCVIVP